MELNDQHRPLKNLTHVEFLEEGADQSLRKRDVVEAFIGSDPQRIQYYTEFEVAPTKEKLDLTLNLPEKDFDWSSRFESAVKLGEGQSVDLRDAYSAEGAHRRKAEDRSRWRINLYRCDRANKAFLAWSPTISGSFHAPEKFGVLEFVE